MKKGKKKSGKRKGNLFKELGFKSKKEFEDFFDLEIEEEKIDKIISAIFGKLDYYDNYLRNIVVFPRETWVAAKESSIFSEKEKRLAIKYLCLLQYYYRKIFPALYTRDKEKARKFLTEFRKDWPKIKEFTLSLIDRGAEYWKKEYEKVDSEKEEEGANYFF